MEAEKVKCLIIGSGPAGYTAAIYAARANLSPVLYEGLQPGGQLTTTTDIENFPGYPEGISGTQMMDDLRRQAERFGTDLRYGVATAADLSRSPYKITIDEEKVIEAQTIIIATGAAAKYLGLEDEKKYAGMGVSACATCDGFFYRKKVVAVVGGGNSGIEAAIDLAGICSKVTVFEFMDELKADNVLQERLKTLPNVEVFVSSQTTEVVGNGDKLTALRIKDRKTEEERLVELDGVFVQIGLSANSSAFREVVETNRPGEIVIDAHCRTNVTGIYAAGDVSTVPYKQIIISMGEGAKAALSAFDDRVRGVI